MLVSFEAYCIDFGGTFPRAVAAPNADVGIAPANVAAALTAAVHIWRSRRQLAWARRAA